MNFVEHARKLKRFDNFFVLILLTAGLLFTASLSLAAELCEVVVKTPKKQNQSPDLLDSNKLVELAASIKNRAAEIDPVKSHVPELVLPVRQYVLQIRLALKEKNQERLYATRKPMLENVINEIESRIANDQVTYEFSAVLPIRVGWLLKMSEKNPSPMLKDPRFNQPIPDVETSYFYRTQTYLTHENFMAALEKINSFVVGTHNGYPNRPPLLKVFYQSLKRFPDLIYLPAFHHIDMVPMNKLMAAKTYPIGNLRHALGLSRLDGIFFDEASFPWHDWGHAYGIEENPTSGTLTEKIVGTLEVETLKQTNLQEGRRAEIWNVFHFLIFHESIRYDYTDLTVNGLKSHYRLGLKDELKNIRKKQAGPEIYPKWLLKMTEEQQDELLNQEADLYMNMFENQIDLHLDLIQSELAMIKRVSGQ